MISNRTNYKKAKQNLEPIYMTIEEPYLKLRIKKSKRVDFLDALEVIERSNHTKDENFYYVSYNEANRDAKFLFNDVWRFKATRVWVDGKEILKEEKYSERSIDNTIFCPYKEKCEGLCMHNIEFGMWDDIPYDDPFHDDKIAQTKSVIGLEKWFDETNEKLTLNSRNEYIVEEMIKYSIMELKPDEEIISVDKNILKEFILRRLNFEMGYCSILSMEKTLGIVSRAPEEIQISEDFIRYFKMKTERYLGVLSRTSRDEVETKEEDYEYEKKQAEFIGKEVEKRLRKVLSEFFDKKG